MKILVIDDSNTIREYLRLYLEKAGYEVVGEAKDGEEGLSKYKKLNPDLVFLDIKMPKMDGMDCLKSIINYDKNAKVIMVTIVGGLENIVDAVNAGAAGYITKPFNEEQLIKAIKKVLKGNILK